MKGIETSKAFKTMRIMKLRIFENLLIIILNLHYSGKHRLY